MKKRTAVVIVGAVAAGTTTAAVASLAVWSLIPITVWSISVTVIGSQTMNVVRVKTGRLQPIQVIAPKKEKQVALQVVS